MAIAIAVTVFVGFAPTYYLLALIHGVTSRGVNAGSELTPLVHVHAAVFSLWIVLFVTQTTFIARGQYDLHRALGMASFLLAAMMLVVGYLTATHAARIGSSPPGWDDKAFLLIPLSSLALFMGFMIAGVLNRHRAAYHKRLMLLATISLLLPALARIVRMTDAPFLPLGVLGGLLVLNLYVAAMISYDLWRLGRVHPVTIWGTMIVLIAWPLRAMFGYTDAWQHFARILVG
jgi:uncharacterized membrane protein YozB (DUF420 family)